MSRRPVCLSLPPAARKALRLLPRAAAWLAVLAIMAFSHFVIHTYQIASWSSRGRLHNTVDSVPHARVALIFGTSDKIGGRENLYFRYRIDAAAALWQAGKVEVFIVSGDNQTPYYNEPQRMREALIARGVPKERIVRDFAGLRTLESVIRAKQIFGADAVLFVSQKFQNERAIYLAKAHGIEAHGFNARDVGPRAGFKTRLREVGARVRMWLDVNLLGTTPRHLGDPEPLPELPPARP